MVNGGSVRCREQSNMNKVRFGVVGVGPWGELHAHALARRPAAELAAVCDLNEGRARLVVAATGARMYYTNYESLFADGSIDAVCIATPDHLHLEIASAAVRAGKHLLVEKPLATTVEEAEVIADLARQAKVKLMVNFHHRWHPALWGAWESIRNNRIGEPHLLALRWNHRLEFYQICLRQQPRSIRLHLLLAEELRKSGRLGEARGILMDARRITPVHQKVRQRL